MKEGCSTAKAASGFAFEDAGRAGWKFRQGRTGPHRALQQLAAAIRADALQLGTVAGTAEGALERADDRTWRISCQVCITAFAIGAHLERHLDIPRGRRVVTKCLF
jgi:hypothetical protein